MTPQKVSSSASLFHYHTPFIVDAPPIVETENEVDPLLDHDQLALTDDTNAPQPHLALCDRLSLQIKSQLTQFKKLFNGGMWRTTILLLLIW